MTAHKQKVIAILRKENPLLAKVLFRVENESSQKSSSFPKRKRNNYQK